MAKFGDIRLYWRYWHKLCLRAGYPCEYTREEALEIARKYNLESEVKLAMRKGCTPDEALMDWDLYDYSRHKGR